MAFKQDFNPYSVAAEVGLRRHNNRSLKPYSVLPLLLGPSNNALAGHMQYKPG
jgi:hypothetical protein